MNGATYLQILPPPDAVRGKILVADVQGAQQTDEVKRLP